MSAYNILFYSLKSQPCIDLITLLKNSNLLRHFRMFCIDESSNKMPSYIKFVPTLIINNIPKPLEGPEAFNWVNMARQWTTQNTMNMQALTNPAYQMNMVRMQQMQINTQNNQLPKSNLLGFVNTEMNSFSDRFTLVKDNNDL